MLAHQGGWDEILLVLGPILIIAGLLHLAKKRVQAAQPPADPAAGPAAGPSTEATPDSVDDDRPA